MYFLVHLNSNNKQIKRSELFNCWARKNQLNSTITKQTAVINRYFLTHCFLLLIKNEATACVGQTQSKL